MSRQIGEQIHRVKQVVDRLHIREAPNSSDESVTRQFGFIQFTDNGFDENTRLSQYIHLALDTRPDVIVQFLRDAWRLRTPDLIISIAGGAKHCDLSARLRKTFQLGLVAAAATTNAWIITAGTNAGVIREVGQALNKYRYKNQKDGIDIPCIGVASWGYTAGKEQLGRSISNISGCFTNDSNSATSSSRRLRYNLGIDAVQLTGEAVYNVRPYRVKEKEEKRCDLEPNHTHFLLFDDGSSMPDNVLGLRADIERLSRRINLEQTAEGSVPTPIPIVMVLVEGGKASIKTMCEALDSNTPVVVVKESGRAADLVADIVTCISQEATEMTSPEHEEDGDHRLRQRKSLIKTTARLSLLNIIFHRARVNNPWVDEIRDDLCRLLLERRHLVTIFNFDSEQHHGRLEEAILEAVFNATKFSTERNEQYRSTAELRLALAWHNVDYARRAIFTDSTISKWKDEDLRQGLVDALRRNYIDFIELFIEYGISLENLTFGDLEYLYSTASFEETLPLEQMQSDCPTRDEFYEEYLRNHVETYHSKNAPLGEHARRELFFWSIFIDRMDFATYLCSKTWNQSTALLYGARIYRKAAAMTLDSEMKQKYENNATKFDKYAGSIIDRCFEKDRDFAVNIVRRPAIAFYNVEPLRLAVRANCRAFLASKCVQKYLDNEWFGNINYKRQNINLRIFFCSIFLPLLPILCGTLPYLHRYQPFNPNSIVPSKSRNPANNFTSSRREVRWSKKFVYFYRAPIVRFYYNLIFFICFLGLFSYVILVDFFPLNVFDGHRSGIYRLPISLTEMWLHMCVWGIIVEEIRQFIFMHSYGEYFDELSNWLDLTAIVLYIFAFFTRFLVNETCFMVSKIALGIDLILWYIRILHFFAAFERLGPKLIMIFNTMKDLLFFVCFILIFLFGFSITSWSFLISSAQVKWIYDSQNRLINITISQDNGHNWSWKLLHDVTNYGVWKVFGQVDLSETTNPFSAMAFVLTILFVTISNVLLINVLVALFNVTIGNVHDQSHNLWRYQRFLLINEFRKKSLLPPPLNVIHCLITLIVYCKRRCGKSRQRHTSLFDDKIRIDIGGIEENFSTHPLRITESMKRESAIAEDIWRDILTKLDTKQ